MKVDWKGLKQKKQQELPAAEEARKKRIEKIEGMLPENYKVVDKKDVENTTGNGFDPEDIVEGSVWECVSNPERDWTVDMRVGETYTLFSDSAGDLKLYDDVGARVGIVDATCIRQNRPEIFLAHFKRVK